MREDRDDVERHSITADYPAALARFEREAMSVARLTLPNIVSITTVRQAISWRSRMTSPPKWPDRSRFPLRVDRSDSRSEDDGQSIRIVTEHAGLLLPEHDEGNDRGRSDCGKKGGEQRRTAEYGDRSKRGADVPRTDLMEETRQQPRHGERTRKAQNDVAPDGRFLVATPTEPDADGPTLISMILSSRACGHHGLVNRDRSRNARP